MKHQDHANLRHADYSDICAAAAAAGKGKSKVTHKRRQKGREYQCTTGRKERKSPTRRVEKGEWHTRTRNVLLYCSL